MKRIVDAQQRVDPEKAQTNIRHRSFKLSFADNPSGWSDIGYWVRRRSVRPVLFVAFVAAFAIVAASYAILAAGGYGAYLYGYNYSYVGGSFHGPPPTMAPGQKAAVSFSLRNTGNQIWCGPSCATYLLIRSSTNSSAPPGPSGVTSPLYTPGNWVDQETPTALQTSVGVGAAVTFSFTITAPQTPGTYQLYVSPRVHDKGFMDTIPVTIRISVPGPPSVALQGVPGTIQNVITLAASASSAIGISGVQFKVDGVNIGGEDTSNPYAVSWNSHSVANGRHTISATAFDAVGRSAAASQIVSVSNAPSTGGGGGSGGGGSGGSGSSGHSGSGSAPAAASPPPSDVSSAIDQVVPEVGTPSDNGTGAGVTSQPTIQGKKSCNYVLASLSGGVFGDIVCTIKHAL